MAAQRRSKMTPAERRLDHLKLLSLVVAVPMVVLGLTTDATYLLPLAAILLGVVNIATEVVRARRFGHPTLNRWIRRR